MASTFQRARTAEQREERRRAILDTATQMLAEMPVGSVTLNELSNRVGLARSNVLRYFESREVILLELLATSAARWLALRVEQLPERIAPTWSLPRRQETLARELAAAFDSDPVLCDLLSAQAGVLEHNVSTEAAIRYRTAVLTNINGLADLLVEIIPELGKAESRAAASTMIVLVGAMWIHTHPAEAMLAAFATDPALNTFDSFPEELRRGFLIALRGVRA